MFFKGSLFGVAFFWYFVFVIIPLCILTYFSFATNGLYGQINFRLTLENYFRILELSYVRIIFNSLILGGLTALFCILLSLWISFKLHYLKSEKALAYLGFILCPFVINSIIRYYSYRWFISPKGLLSEYLNWDLVPSSLILLAGMISTYLPFALVPIFVGFLNFEKEQIESAWDMGASKFQILILVQLPQLKKSLLSSFVLVFIPALGEFVVPDLLGGAQHVFVGNLVTDQFLRYRNWPFGSTIVVVLIVFFLMGRVLDSWLKSAKKVRLHAEK